MIASGHGAQGTTFTGGDRRASACPCIVALLFLILPAVGVDAAQVCDRPAVAEVASSGARFDSRDDGTVTDLRSRLMWTRCSAGQTWSDHRCAGEARALDYQSAMGLAEDVNRNGSLFFSDWRLPRAPELASIAQRDCSDPRIDLALFPDTPSGFYWTTTTRPQPADGFVYALSFGAEGIRYVDKQQTAHLRLVRDAR